MSDASRQREMLYLVFGHTAQDPPVRLGPMPSFRVRGAEIVDHTGAALARHNGHRWQVKGRDYYRVDCAGPVVVRPEAGAARGPFEHFSLVNGTAYASRDLFAHYSESDDTWLMHHSDVRAAVLVVMPG